MIFIDTWGFKAYIDKKEEKHTKVKEYIEKTWKNKQQLVTSDYIIDETITLLSYRLDYEKVKIFIEKLELSIDRGYINLVRVSIEDFEEAIKKKLKYKDKLGISFTDLTSMEIMLRLKIENIITEDKHFQDVGFGFKALFVK
ncbi:MAG: hypothetical protein A2086_03020 [Spirochaetes bacterium GWD1_27_9]|nr:MAG: hypothetical protein A2Z98_14015 [Spirochaetes bacterium GWB1_27_13]OHD27412.1 MAG: hypothetical protein A2Y34_10630 [Spirochaetes bacterium GWC1_27_15]OHD31357.1 MAG: hypothetical protein A2086_03020 [Spirochaetes bacterium GWD1_27_9]